MKTPRMNSSRPLINCKLHHSRALLETTLVMVACWSIMLASCESNTDAEYDIESSMRAISVFPSEVEIDVDGIELSILPVSCDDGAPIDDEEPSTVFQTLEDQTLPGNLTGFIDQPLDEFSNHLFADFFTVLPPGCYDVSAAPVTAAREPSQDCASATKRGVEVFGGETTEVFLINQCINPDNGALDVVAAANVEPKIVDVEFDESKFVCGYETDVCAIADDPDFDPIELTLTAPDEEACFIYPLGYPTQGELGYELCWGVYCDVIGRVALQVVAKDQLWHDGELITYEQWLESEGYPNQSRSELAFFAYFDQPDEYQTYPGYDQVDQGGYVCLEKQQ